MELQVWKSRGVQVNHRNHCFDWKVRRCRRKRILKYISVYEFYFKDIFACTECFWMLVDYSLGPVRY